MRIRTVVIYVNTSGFYLSRFGFAVAFSVVLLIVGFAVGSVAAENPILGVDVHHSGNLWLFQLNTQLVAYARDLNASTSIFWLSNGFNSSLTFYVIGTGGQFGNLTKMVVQIQDFGVTYVNRTRLSLNPPQGYNQIYVAPAVSEAILKYQLDLTNFTKAFENVLPSTFNATSQQVFIGGQVFVSIVWSGAIQETAETKFIRVGLACDCPGTSAYVGVGILEENARLIAGQIGQKNLEMFAPNSFNTQYVIAPNEVTQVYAEWDIVKSPPWYETQPYDWVISGVIGGGIGATITAAATVVYRRIKLWKG